VDLLTRLRKLFSPPEFPDEDTQRVASTVHRIGLALAPIDLIGAAVMAFMLPRPFPRLYIALFFLAVVAAALLLVRRAQVTRGAQVLVAGIWFSLALGLIVSRNATTPALSGFVLAIAAAGLLLGRRAPFVVAALSAIAGPVIWSFDLHLAVPPGPMSSMPFGAWIVQASIYLGAAVLVSIATRHAEQSRDRARQSEARFRALADHAPDMIAEFDAQGRFVYANPAALQGSQLGDVGQLARERVGAWIHPEDAPMVIERFAELAARGGSARAAYRVQAAAGKMLWLESLAVRFTDAQGERRVVSVTRNVTRQREVEAALRESEERYRMLADHAPDMIVEHDHTGRIIYANRRTLDFMGYDLAELGALGLGEWTHPEDREECERGFREVMEAGRPMRLVHRLRRKDGTYTWVSSSGAPIKNARGETHMVAQSRDLTEELSLLEQLRQAQKMEAIGRLAGGVAHDFNNLLTVIGGYAGVLESALPPASTEANAAHEIIEATERAAALTRQLLLLSRRQLVQPGVVDLNAAIRGFETVLRRTLPESIRLELALDPNLPAIDIDPSQVDQVLLNLALNGRDAIRGQGTLRIETQAGPDGRSVHLRVSDDGQGMTEETRVRAFEPFFTTKPAGAGTGLGLSTTYGIVRQAQGSIALESTPGVGTTVEISLPAARERATPASSRSNGATAPRAGRDVSVLLVEDDVAVRRLLAILLEAAGYRVTAAADGAEALELVQKSGRPFDLLLTDYVMPGQSGVELCNALRARWPDLRVVLMTGHAEVPGVGATELPRAVELIGKPFTRDQLQRVIAKQFEIP
jgi:two-component system cell cycle sensor histidine kinase/response regulator CckA